MKEITILLQMLAAHVYQAKLGGTPIRDTVDFKAWLIRLSKKAEISTDMENFLLHLDD